jgi:hypothetical protein
LGGRDEWLNYNMEVVMTPKEKIIQARKHVSEKDAIYKREKATHLREIEGAIKYFELDILPGLLPATNRDYEAWLCAFLRQGGEITHAYDYPMPKETYVVSSGVKVIDLKLGYCGSDAFNLIIPPDSQVEIRGNIGHCLIFDCRDFDKVPWMVPVWKNIECF